jgi:hypothetical protein
MRGVWWEGTAVEVLQAGGDCQDELQSLHWD